MNTTPTWRIPHYFLRLPPAGAPDEPRYVFTYGLLVPEIFGGETLVSPRLFDRVGLPWIASLADALRSDPLPPSKLGTFLRDGVGISHPYETSRRLKLGRAIPAIIPEQLATFVAEEQGQIHEYYSHFRVSEFVAELRAAATERRRPVASDAVVTSMATLAARANLKLSPQKLRSGEGWAWALSVTNLQQRIALELFELATDRPRLRTCQFCEAIFVPRAREANCRFHLWPALAEAGTEPLFPCSPSFHEYFDPSAEHTRERRRLWTRYRRAANAYGEEHARTKRREKEFETYMDEHSLRRGRRLRRPDSRADITQPAASNRDG